MPIYRVRKKLRESERESEREREREREDAGAILIFLAHYCSLMKHVCDSHSLILSLSFTCSPSRVLSHFHRTPNVFMG